MIRDVAPRQPEQFAALGRKVADAPYPSVRNPLTEPPVPGQSSLPPIRADLDERVRDAIVRVTGDACDYEQAGTGWAYAPELVITNAHVVAGAERTTVEGRSGVRYDGTVVAFDPVRDLAAVHVPELEVDPLALVARGTEDLGAIYGHPGGGALRAVAARVELDDHLLTSDIHGSDSHLRHVYALAAALQPGDSGGPLVNDEGDVIGIAFAVDAHYDERSYAAADDEIRAFLTSDVTEPVNTGGCLSDERAK